LAEVLLWHAFGRFPEQMRLPGMAKDWRFSDDALEDYKAPHPGGFILSPTECEYAAILPDPAGQARAMGVEMLRPNQYPEALNIAAALKGRDSDLYRAFEYAFEVSKAIHEKFDGWEQARDEYLEPFVAEIFLLLRHGKLKARGTKLPFSDRKAVDKYLSFKEIGLIDLDVVDVPTDLWLSKAINWEESTLTHSDHAFIWLHFDTPQVLRLLPPKRKLAPTMSGILGGELSLTTSPVVPEGISNAKRGRPPLPWERFHVEVARMFRDGEVPPKKESAIEYIIGWFKREMHEDVSRSAVGERLKIYYDRLVRPKAENQDS
jgi:hypothetical protein